MCHVAVFFFAKELQMNGTAFSAAGHVLFPFLGQSPGVRIFSEFNFGVCSILVLVSQGDVSLRTETAQRGLESNNIQSSTNFCITGKLNYY